MAGLVLVGLQSWSVCVPVCVPQCKGHGYPSLSPMRIRSAGWLAGGGHCGHAGAPPSSINKAATEAEGCAHQLGGAWGGQKGTRNDP
mmetsp:Transcript_99736/g.171809  ORF Transcript_99736/g.171809 Transcript_99736/m.171809 type:complete len:87 (+) Transcript_99736:40-300(+)